MGPTLRCTQVSNSEFGSNIIHRKRTHLNMKNSKICGQQHFCTPAGGVGWILYY